MLRFAVLLILCGAVGGSQDRPNSPSESEKDVYLIYSLLLTNPKTSHGPDNNPRYFIEATTVPGRPPEPCVRPPKDREPAFREVLADFERRKGTPRELKPLFSIPKSYFLLTKEEAKALMNDRRLSPDPRVPDPRFRGVTDLFTLSDVYFNQSHTLALTGMGTWCGSLCGSYNWKVFERVGTDKWEELPWISCMTIADARHH